jgi:hypothetical protein
MSCWLRVQKPGFLPTSPIEPLAWGDCSALQRPVDLDFYGPFFCLFTHDLNII